MTVSTREIRGTKRQRMACMSNIVHGSQKSSVCRCSCVVRFRPPQSFGLDDLRNGAVPHSQVRERRERQKPRLPYPPPPPSSVILKRRRYVAMIGESRQRSLGRRGLWSIRQIKKQTDVSSQPPLAETGKGRWVIGSFCHVHVGI